MKARAVSAAIDNKRDRAMLAIAPLVLGLNEKGKVALATEGSAYLSDDELEKLYAIVHAVARELAR